MRTPARSRPAVALVAAALAVGATAPAAAGPPSAVAAAAPHPGAALADTGHLTTLTTRVAPPQQAGHTTYRLAEEPEVGVLWTYAEPVAGADPGSAAGWDLLGGGDLDPATGHWSQGAFNADDVTRAAVAFTRHWRATGDDASREQAYQLLRGAMYLQTTEQAGRPGDTGNVVLWMQPDGVLNPSAEPVELPDPSDSAESYWLARTVWALGEGYAAFEDDDPAFAAYLAARIDLALGALERQSLSRYGQWEVSDSERVPAWLVTGGADATSEAVLGLAAFVEARSDGPAGPAGPAGAVGQRAREALARYAEGVAAMGTPTRTDAGAPAWPYGAVLPWTGSRSQWHAWGAQMPAALVRAAEVLDDATADRLRAPAVADVETFTPLLLASGGPDSSWAPTPVDTSQIAYGADARVQAALAVGDEQLAGVAGAWFFGANPAGVPVYDPATGVTNDGVDEDGSVNANSGAESTIHGLLAALALDAHPEAAAVATTRTRVAASTGLQVVEAEGALPSGRSDPPSGTVVTLPEGEAWTGEAEWGGGAYLSLPVGSAARLALPAARPDGDGDGPWWASLVVDLPGAAGETSARLAVTAVDTTDGTATDLGTLALTGVEQGVSEGPGSLRALALPVPVPASSDVLVVTAVAGDAEDAASPGAVSLDAVLLAPSTASLTLADADGTTTTVSADLAAR